jgi:atypical dual specificity phosphatase
MARGARVTPLSSEAESPPPSASASSSSSSSSSSSRSTSAPPTSPPRPRSLFGAILRGIEHLIVGCIRALPGEVRYVLTLIAFWPTVAFNRIFCWLFPSRRQLWNRIGTNIVCGSVPLRESDVEALVIQERIGAVVNMCREWNVHHQSGLYSRLGVEQLHLPTIDFDAPALEDLKKGVAFIRRHAQEGKTVYVHCKAGRGRSVALCLAYMVAHEDMTPQEADAQIRAVRPHISKKWHLPCVVHFHSSKTAEAGAGAGSAAVAGDESPSASTPVPGAAGGSGRHGAAASGAVAVPTSSSSDDSVATDASATPLIGEGETAPLAPMPRVKSSRSESATRKRPSAPSVAVLAGAGTGGGPGGLV